MSTALFKRMSDATRQIAVTAAFEASVGAVAGRRQLPMELVRTVRRRSQGAGRARREAIYLTHTYYSVPMRAIARHLGIDPALCSRVCHAIENQRDDDREYDRVLDEMQLELMA